MKTQPKNKQITKEEVIIMTLIIIHNMGTLAKVILNKGPRHGLSNIKDHQQSITANTTRVVVILIITTITINLHLIIRLQIHTISNNKCTPHNITSTRMDTIIYTHIKAMDRPVVAEAQTTVHLALMQDLTIQVEMQ